ncbi:MAG TPA: FtsX-like permease family protein, partial [Syntrophomonas sp.]|nr:FtsX-like permease family protein [Syntrophomonas sp.]
VALGVMVYIGMGTAYGNLSRSQQEFYQAANFADYYFQVVRAPSSVSSKIESIAGIVKASGRIQRDVSLVKEGSQRAVGRITSYHLPMEGEVNQLHLLSGRMFASRSSGGGVEVLLDPQYADANHVQIDDHITIIAEGRKVNLHVVGTAISPEFVYALPDAATMMPDPLNFGIIMMATEQAQQILDMPDQVNQVVVKLAPGSDEKAIRQRTEELLRSYGNIASYPRKDQLSHAMLQAELDGLKINSHFLPLVLLLIAAAIQFVILNRLVKSHRTQIGIMKAIGYNDYQIIGHYTTYALVVSVIGCIAGMIAGVFLASSMSSVYSLYFNLPQAIGGINRQTLLQSVALSISVGAASGFLAARTVIRINPAEAMRLPAPPQGNKILLERWAKLWTRLNSSWKMSLRSISRNRTRSLVTILGVMSAVVLLVFSMFTNDAVDYMLNRNFNEVNRYDYTVRLAEPIEYREIQYWQQWKDIYQIEPQLEMPIKIFYNGRSEDELCIGMTRDSDLKRVLNQAGERLQIPEEGLLISRRMAQRLGVRTGDKVRVETKMSVGATHSTELLVTGINDQLMGSGSYVSLETANRMLDEKRIINMVMFKAAAVSGDSIEKRFNAMPKVSSVTSRAKELQSFYDLMDTTVIFIGIMILLSALLGLVIVYNSSLMAFNERRRELASLKVLGYSNPEIAGILRKETWLLAAIGIVFGLPAGKGMGQAYIASVSTDLYSLPVIIYPRSYLMAALGAVVFVAIGHYLAVRKAGQLDMVEVLKNRE